MRLGLSRLGIVALVVAVVLTLGFFRPGADTPTAETAFWHPGGILVLPSFFPALPGAVDQVAPAIIPASPPGNKAMIAVFADPWTLAFPDTGAVFDSDCNVTAAGSWDFLGSVCFKVQALDIPTGTLGPTMARFAANNQDRLLCNETALCDRDTIVNDGDMAVFLNGGGKDEVLVVTATDEAGDTRTVQVITVQTMIAVPPVVEPGQTPLISGMEGISLVGYRCNDVGLTSTLAGMSNFLYSITWGLTILGTGEQGQLYGCGGNVPSTTIQRSVMFQTDKGQMSAEPLLVAPAFGAVILPQTQCPIGKSVSVTDSVTSWPGGAPLLPVSLQNCDLDAAPNGVVSYMVVRTADVGVATITAQQGGMAGSTRQTNVNFVGTPGTGIIPTIQLYTPDIEDLPARISPLSQVEVVALVLNQQVNPVAGITVSCSLDPVGAGFALLLDRDTTGSDGMAHFTMVPTGIPGMEVTLSCSLDGYPDVPPATHAFDLSLEPDLEAVDLVAGCNNEASTWPDGTAAATVADGVDPADALSALWVYDAVSGTWLGYAPDVPADVNDLSTVDRLEPVFFCVDADATLNRPVL